MMLQFGSKRNGSCTNLFHIQIHIHQQLHWKFTHTVANECVSAYETKLYNYHCVLIPTEAYVTPSASSTFLCDDKYLT